MADKTPIQPSFRFSFRPPMRLLSELMGDIKQVDSFLEAERATKDEIEELARWTIENTVEYEWWRRKIIRDRDAAGVLVIWKFRVTAACAASFWTHWFRRDFERLISLRGHPVASMLSRLRSLPFGMEPCQRSEPDAILDGIGQLLDQYGSARRYIGDYMAATHEETAFELAESRKAQTRNLPTSGLAERQQAAGQIKQQVQDYAKHLKKLGISKSDAIDQLAEKQWTYTRRDGEPGGPVSRSESQIRNYLKNWEEL